MVLVVLHVLTVKIWRDWRVGKATVGTHVAAIFDVIELAGVHFGVVGVLALLILAARATEEKFAYFLSKSVPTFAMSG